MVALSIPRSHLDRLDALLPAPRNANKPLVEGVMEVIMEALRLATMAVTMVTMAVMVAAPLIPTVPATNSVTGHIAGMTTGDA